VIFRKIAFIKCSIALTDSFFGTSARFENPALVGRVLEEKAALNINGCAKYDYSLGLLDIRRLFLGSLETTI
jgi:hypothetical protein